ncbi:MAG: group 1 truncated hemoglobin [Cytophagaceae bacterium]|nr:group 1 truncated hemoglobin [Cytophagaceae bacterium]MBL0301412.1 group 1 truncated hemoglobin [Cytophagaceae bacterium]MBL0324231.1 group 1 truncated hemoglobin [Cytophagaceae bacterium]
MKKLKISVLMAAFVLSLSACQKEEEMTTPTLYDRLGGVNAISAVVDEFIGRVAVNPDMVRTFKPLLDDVTKNGASSARLASLRNNLIDQIGEAAGGPQKYKGKDMVTAHKGMMITEKEFNSLAGDLSGALDKFNVPATEKGELLTVIGSLKPQIVGQ